MKKYFILILLLISTKLLCQTSTKKFNSQLNRYEHFDSNGNLTGYESYNKFNQQWEYFSADQYYGVGKKKRSDTYDDLNDDQDKMISNLLELKKQQSNNVNLNHNQTQTNNNNYDTELWKERYLNNQNAENQKQIRLSQINIDLIETELNIRKLENSLNNLNKEKYSSKIKDLYILKLKLEKKYKGKYKKYPEFILENSKLNNKIDNLEFDIKLNL